MGLQDFTWFDKAATEDSPAHRGFLSKLGRTIQGVAAPYAAAYGNDSGYKQLALNQQQDQADLEFQKYLADKKIKEGELGIKKTEANNNNALMAAYLKSQGIDIGSLLGEKNNSPLPSLPIGQAIQPPPGAMMSMAQGGYGNVQGQPIQGQLPQQNISPQASAMFSGMQPSFTGGKFNLKPSAYGTSPQEAAQAGQMLVDKTLVPSQIPGRSGKLQAINAAKSIDPNYNAAEADMNFAVTKMGAGAFEKNFNNLDSFSRDFDKNADYLLKISSKFDRSKLPIINQAIVRGKQFITGDPEATKVIQTLNTVSNGYARLQNPTLSGQALSDAARSEARELANKFQSHDQIVALLDPKEGSMRIEQNNRIEAAQEVKDRIKSTISTGKKSEKKINKDNLFEGL